MTPQFFTDELGQGGAKVCTACGKSLGNEHFYTNKETGKPVSPCKECRRARSNEPEIKDKKNRLKRDRWADRKLRGEPAYKAPIRKLDSSRLRQLLGYAPETGLFTWLDSRRGVVMVGDAAGSLNVHGYVAIRVDGKTYLAHRLAWFYVHGQWPALHIDHINGVKTDNRIANLRDVPAAVNRQNERRARRNSKVGLLGVSQTLDGTFTATIKVSGKKIYLGCYRTAEEAHAVYLNAKREKHAGFML